MKHFVLFSLLIAGFLQMVPGANAQVRLDSIVSYTYTSNGNDSLPIRKRLFDYEVNGKLSAERQLESANFVHWTNSLRKKYIYNSKGRLERINKDSFMGASSTWKNYYFQKRTHSSDSDFVVRYYQRAGSIFDTLNKVNRISLFANGNRKAFTKRYFDNFAQKWITQQFDSLVMDYHKNEVIKEYTAGRLFHYSGASTNFFRLDSITAPIFNLKYRTYTSELPNPPANRRIYISKAKKAPDYKEYSTSDSLVYFLNSNGLPDSSHRYLLYWNAPEFNGINEKEYYSWKGTQLESHTTTFKSGNTFFLYKKWEYSQSLGGLSRDTIFYKNDGSTLDKETKETTLLDKNSRTQSISYYRWSSIVDSFSINEKDIYYYTDPATGVDAKSATAETIKVFPNPSSGLVHIETNSPGELVLYDLQGKIIQHINPNQGKRTLLSDKGVFLLKQPSSGQVLKVIVR